MGLLSADVALSDFWRIRVLLQPTGGSSPSLFSSISLALVNHFSCIPVSALPLSPSDPYAAPFVSPSSPRRQQAAFLCLSFVTPQYENSDWSDLYVHKQVLGAVAIHVPPAQTAQLAVYAPQAPCSPQAAYTPQDEAKTQAAAFRSMLQEEYPTVLAKRIICLFPPVAARDATGTAGGARSAPDTAATAAAGDEDEELVFLPGDLWDALHGSSRPGAPPFPGTLVAALEGPLKAFFASLLRQMGALVLRSPERCRPLVTPLDGALLSPPVGDALGALPAMVGIGRLTATPPIPGVQTGAANLLRLLPSRLQKQTADLLLLGGDPAAAAQLYLTAAEAARAHGDVIWQAAAVEGQAAAVYAHVQQSLLGRSVGPRGTAGSGGPSSGLRSSGGSRADLEDTAVGAAAEDRDLGVQRSSSLPASSPEGALEGCQGVEPLPPPIEAILLQYQQRRAGATPGGGPPGGPGGGPAADSSGGRSLPLLQPLGGGGGPYGVPPGAFGAGDREADKAHAEQVQMALDAVVRKLRDACQSYQSHPGGFLLNSCCSLLLCRFLASHGSKLECLQCVSSAAERAKRLEIKDFVCLLGALAGLCETLGAPRKLAFLLHRVCMALMEAKKWEAAHYAAALAAPCYHLSSLQLAPPDRLHPLAYTRAESSRGCGGFARAEPQTPAPHDSEGETDGEGQDLEGFFRHSPGSLAASRGPLGGGAAGDLRGPSPTPAEILQDRSESPYCPVYHREASLRGFSPVPSNRGNRGYGDSGKARGAFLSALWRLMQELHASGAPQDSLRGWSGWVSPVEAPGGPQKGAQGPSSISSAQSLQAFLSKHIERLRFEGDSVRVAWPALQSRVLHVLKVSAEQLGDSSRVAWYSFASLKLLYPVIDAKAQASAVMVVQAAAGRRQRPLSLPPVLTILRPKASSECRGLGGGNIKGNNNAWGPPGASKTGSRGNEEKVTYLGGMCRGSVAPLPLLTKLLPLVDGGPLGGPTQTPAGAEPVTTIIHKRDHHPGPAPADSLGAPQGPSTYPLGGEEGDSGPPGVSWPLGAPAGPGGPSKGGRGDVLMFNPFKKDHQSREAPRPLEASGLWVRGELRTVHISVRNCLSVELVLDKAKVIVAGAKAEVYPVTVLVPPSAAHQVTFEVTVMPRETGRLYFVGLSYTLNRVHCCQLLVRQSSHLDAFLSSRGFGTPPGGPQPRDAAGGPLQGLEIRFKAEPAAAPAPAVAATAADTEAPPVEFAEAAGKLLQYSAAACVEVIEELPLLRVSLEAAAPSSFSLSEFLRRRSSAAAAAEQYAQQHRQQQQQVLVHAPAQEGPSAAVGETAEATRRDTLWCSSDSSLSLACSGSRLLTPYPCEGPRWRSSSGVRIQHRETSEEGSLSGETPEDTAAEETDLDGDEQGCDDMDDEDLLAAFSFDARIQQEGNDAKISGEAVASADPRYSPVWEGQHRLLSIHLENVGSHPVRELSFRILNSDGSQPTENQQAALERHFQVLWRCGSSPSCVGPSGTVEFSPEAFVSEDLPSKAQQRGASKLKRAILSSTSCSEWEGLGSSISLSKDEDDSLSGSWEGAGALLGGPVGAGGGPLASAGASLAAAEGPQLITPGQRVRIPLRCVASEKYSSCVLQITYASTAQSAYCRQVSLPLSLRVQRGVQLRPQGLSLFPLSCFDPVSALRALVQSGCCGDALVRELGFGGPPSWEASPEDEGPVRGPSGDSDSDEQAVNDVGELGPAGGPQANLCGAAASLGATWAPSGLGTDSRLSWRGSVDSGVAPFGGALFGSSSLGVSPVVGGPSRLGVLGGAPLRHEFDHKKCILCLDLMNTAPVDFECVVAGGGSKRSTQRLAVGPHDSHARWALWVRRLRLRSCTDVEACLTALDKHLRLQWRTFPSQQGSLSLFSLLESAARLAMLRRGPPGTARTPPAGEGGVLAHTARDEPPRSLEGSAGGVSSASKQSSEQQDTSTAQKQQQQQQQQQQGEGDDPVPAHELMNLLQLPHLDAPKVLLHLRLLGGGLSGRASRPAERPCSFSARNGSPRGAFTASDSYTARIAEALTLHVFVENRTAAPLEGCCVLLIPFSHGSEEVTPGLLWSGPLTADLEGPLLPCRVVRQQQRRLQQQKSGRPPNGSSSSSSEETCAVTALKRRGAVLCHRLALMPCVPGVFYVVAALFCRSQHTLFWHHKPIRLVV